METQWGAFHALASASIDQPIRSGCTVVFLDAPSTPMGHVIIVLYCMRIVYIQTSTRAAPTGKLLVYDQVHSIVSPLM